MVMSIRNDFVALFVVGLLFALAGCPGKNEINPSNVSGYNYTGYYIGGFRIGNEGQEISAGGPNVFPKEPGEERSGGGKYVCCIGIPEKWRSGMKLVVKWNVDKILDGKHLGTWYTATTKVPPYGPRTAGFIVHFLPGDRIRIQIRDEKGVLPTIDDKDPYIVQGVLDPELNKE
ncbi:DUF3304 domain-containing protein [Burkholderia plantarii]|uniref:DUF3304 domain-containing protein n=1 Tax=Burkholderia plantarii TaxID=41899 RepID=UPI0006D8B981|nr:DUF3304 domain-containing protein [Burkholderia plantarii]ALK30132.1 hypothetical protein bpln_1g13170 [Burkholderia plantarii]GLZ22034.1 hypothetical protein Bpla01_55630 [Burkholderia plantarii]